MDMSKWEKTNDHIQLTPTEKPIHGGYREFSDGNKDLKCYVAASRLLFKLQLGEKFSQEKH